MVDIDNPRCRRCQIGECLPVPASLFDQAMGLENFKCNRCGTVFAWRHATALGGEQPEELKEETKR